MEPVIQRSLTAITTGIVREQIHSTVPAADFMAENPPMAPLQERHIPQQQAVTPVRLVDFIMAD